MHMALLLHIIIAITSLLLTTYLFIAPSRLCFRIHYSLIALTVASGTYLVVSLHAQLLETCVTGLVYVGIVSLGTMAARHKFTRAMYMS
jgi:hypothetical protein